MWTKGVLERYADTIENPEQKERLHAEIKAIQFESGTQVCVAMEGEAAFERAGAGHLYRDLGSRVGEFVTQEDMEELGKLAGHVPRGDASATHAIGKKKE